MGKTKAKHATEPEIVIDQEFKALLPRLSDDERKQLEANLIEHGCRNPIIVWATGSDDILVDGHNRYEICCEHGLPHRITRLKFADRDEAKRFMVLNQFGQRNLTDTAKAKLRGIAYNTTKADRGGDRKSNGNGCRLIDTAGTVAEKTGVSERTVRNDAKTAEQLAAIAAMAPELEQAIVAEEIEATRAEIKQLSEATPAQVQRVAEKVAAGETDLTDAMPAKKAKPKDDSPFPDVWAEKPKFDAVVQSIGRLTSEIERLQGTPAGAFLARRRNDTRSLLNDLRDSVKFSAPHQVCPYCKGKGCKMQKGESTACMGLGWTPRGIKGDGT